MAFLTSGGSNVGSAQINDGAIVNADVNAAAAIAQSKLAGSANGDTDLIAFELTNGATHSLTTVANQRVLVIVRAGIRVNSSTLDGTITVSYGGVGKKTIGWDVPSVGTSSLAPVTLMYTEVPGAATANITVASSVYGLEDVQIVVIKMKGTA